jgi:predicted TIM-barrel fold metal-dependent hydrolase
MHAHFVPEPYRLALKSMGLEGTDGVPLPSWDMATHLAHMEAEGIAASVLSLSTGVEFAPIEQGIEIIRSVNVAGAAAMQAHPDKIGFFASLPLPDVDAALEEIDHAFGTLKVDGVVLHSNARGMYLGDPKFAPVFDALNRHHATVFVHPTSPACVVGIGVNLPSASLEFPFDTTRTIVSLIYSGTLKRCPNIKLIVPHLGGATPVLVPRISLVADLPYVSPRPQNGSAEVIEQLRGIYYDLAVTPTPENFTALLQITDTDHIVFGTDYPYPPLSARPGIARNVDEILRRLPRDQRDAIEFANALNLVPRMKSAISQLLQ